MFLLRKASRASAMMFALVVVAVIGVLMAAWGMRSEKVLSIASSRSLSEALQSKADANYERILKATLEAYAWAIQVHSGTPAAALPQAPDLLAGYDENLTTLETRLRGACSNPCTASDMNDFHQRVFPVARAEQDGFRFQITALENAHFESERPEEFPKRFQLVIWQQDSENPGQELRVSGQFTVGPTSFSDFSTLAYSMSPGPLVVGAGQHAKLGLFFALNDAAGQPLTQPAENCITTHEDQNTPPPLRNFSIYYYPPLATTLKADLVASNVGTNRHCFGISRVHQWGYSWGGYSSAHGNIDIKSILVTGNPVSDIETTLKLKADQALIHTPRPASASLRVDSFFQTQNRNQNRHEISPRELKTTSPPSSGSPLPLGVVRFPPLYILLISADTPTSTATTSTTPSSIEYLTSIANSQWKAVRADLQAGNVRSDGSDFHLKYTITYSDMYSGQLQTISLHDGPASDLPRHFEFNIATDAPILYVSPMAGSNKIVWGIKDLTFFTAGPAVFTAPFEAHPNAQNPAAGANMGRVAFVNFGSSGPAAELNDNTLALEYRENPVGAPPTLGAIRNGSAPAPSASQSTIKIDASLISIAPQGGRPAALSTSLLDPGSTPRALGACSFTGALWSRERNDQLRLASPNMQSVVTGCTQINTNFPSKWKSSPLLNIESSELLGVTEMGRTYHLENTSIRSRIAEAKDLLNMP